VEVTINYLEYFEDEYLMAFARDITVRKRAEKALKESKAEAELYVDLMGHDINNMNQVATGYLELALDIMQTEGSIDKEHIDLISKPYNMLLNSSSLIHNIRKIQREKAGQYETRVMDLRKVLEEVKNGYTNVSGRDITVELKLDGECHVAANELLKDIFTNLVGNSIKHSSGPLLINILLSSAVENGKAYCRVSVEDNGPGIADDLKNKLLLSLDPENAKARGKGFGLYLIKQLVSDFNGRFWMEDRVPGDYTQGSRFIVDLPALEG
jgi:signal transduction histidine kinase